MSKISWRDGYGVIQHTEETISRAEHIDFEDRPNRDAMFAAADRLASAAMWLVVHMTYANKVQLNGEDLPESAFKENPEGHTGGSLNMAVAFTGYLLANALSGTTRAWTLGQGHCVAAIEAINALTGDVSSAQQGRYDRSETGLSNLVSDFYSYAITPDGRPGIPLGSHVGPNTAGGISEGGYLGFASLQYVHMPLPGEHLVAFLSDGAFEEQRGSDWSPRWWRTEDSGVAIALMILNGRRIEQRTEIGQEGGTQWLIRHLQLSGFDPIVIDGHDPVAYAWAILEAEKRLAVFSASAERSYPARLPYIVARCVKGFGFAGAGSNHAHNLPLGANPRHDTAARQTFNTGAAALFVPEDILAGSLETLSNHAAQGRVKESQNVLANRRAKLPILPNPVWRDSALGEDHCPMDAVDTYFVMLVDTNRGYRVRIANPDELRSNRMGDTLERLKHRVNVPEPGSPEAVDGAIITALNEEAVISAAFGNKGGLNLAVSYEAFAMKMLGAIRQEIIFARRQTELDDAPGWLSVPIIVSSHTWENAKNEQSHQDPTLPEALLGEMSDTSRVLFPFDSNSAVAALRSVYGTHGKIACLVIPKREVPDLLTGTQAEEAVEKGAIHILGTPEQSSIQMIGIGAYQIGEAIKACGRLQQRGVKACVTALIDPGRFRTGRDELETNFTAPEEEIENLFPSHLPRIILSHTRPEPMLGALRRIDNGPTKTIALGYINRGGTLDRKGMLFANKCSWAHALVAASSILECDPEELLTAEENKAVDGWGDPNCL